MRSTFGLLFLTLSIFGCAASEPAQCIKGQYNLCRCATGQAGTQLCVDGFSVSDCECLPSTASTPGPTPDSPSNPTKPQPPDPNKRWVFVTSATYLANFGFYGASSLCATSAKKAGLDRGNRWEALVRSSSSIPGPVPLTDVLTGKGPWYHVSSDGNFGELVFKDKAAILSGDVQVTPGRDEFGARITTNMAVWVDSGCPEGVGDRAYYWGNRSGTDRGPVFRVGGYGQFRIGDYSQRCDEEAHLLCLEQ